jgi:beta-glucanase (GH16 family)
MLIRPALLPTSLLLVVLGFGLGALSAQTPPPPTLEQSKVTLPPLTPDDKLVWEDDFSKDPAGLPDPTKWVQERGWVRNRETQYYTRNRPENARVENGHLIIEARRETKDSFTPTDNFDEAYGKKWVNTDFKLLNFTSASLTTLGKESWLYGRFEIRAKMPGGTKVWPALWTLGENVGTVGWPRCGEIDLVEMLGSQPHIVGGNFHFAKAKTGEHCFAGGGQLTVPTSDTDFHVYTIDWNADRIDLYVDGVKHSELGVKSAEADGQNPYRKPQYLIMNLALEGNTFNGATFPQQMIIDYVRVYQKAKP